MTRIYSTDSYFRDLHPNINLFSLYLDRFKKLIYGSFDKVLKSDLEVGIVELLMQIPIFLFIIFLGFITIYALVNLNEPDNGYKLTTIVTGSMEPAIKTGSVILLAPNTNPKVGDIVSFKEKSSVSGSYTGRTLSHRIIERRSINNQIAYVTKGDANTQPDPVFVTLPDLRGKVSIVIPYLGYLGLISVTGWGLLCFVLIPSILLIYSEIVSLQKLHPTTRSKTTG